MYEFLLAVVAVVAGAIASLAGFGIGSLLTPLLAIKTGISLAVAGVSIAHLFGTALRFFYLRRFINKRVFISFGLTSAAGGLAGALLQTALQNVVLTIIFGALLVLAGVLELSGLSDKIRFDGVLVWLAGALSGLFGGLVGNQGGIRSVALLNFNLNKNEFVATATGIALIVDAARVPVYLAVQWQQFETIWLYILITISGVIAGTVAGRKILSKLHPTAFKKSVAVIILTIGILTLINR